MAKLGIRWLCAGLALLGATGCSDDLTTPSPGSPALSRSAGSAAGAIPDQYVVVLRSSVHDVAALTEELVTAPGDSVLFVYEHALRGFAARLSPATVRGLARSPHVARITQDEQALPDQAIWGLDRVDQRGLPLDETYAPERNGTGVNVYVIDTGIRKSHQEFDWGARALHGYTAVSDGRGSEDCNGHGTHVAGSLGGTSYGAAKGATLHAVRIGGCDGYASVSNLIAALDWLVVNRVEPAVANLSYSWSARSDVDDAVQKVIEAGVLVVTSAGNDDADACGYSPNRKSNVLTVANSTSADARYATSNWGSCVKVFAPGTDILSAWIGSDTDTRTFTGTSMSSPHVAGIAAIYLQGDPWAAPWKVQDAVVSSATGGVVTDPRGAPDRLAYAFPVYFGVSVSGPTAITSSGEHTWEAMPEGGDGSYAYQWSVFWYATGTAETLGTAKTQSLHLFGGEGDFVISVEARSAGQTKVSDHFVSDGSTDCGAEAIC